MSCATPLLSDNAADLCAAPWTRPAHRVDAQRGTDKRREDHENDHRNPGQSAEASQAKHGPGDPQDRAKITPGTDAPLARSRDFSGTGSSFIYREYVRFACLGP